ncbi:hypothetical protein V5O48_002803 [Marasmius crinis-equi]|uniref:SUZ domain-containing protein n=1 Tax=Marasmius crinis-equi TaxID=585013 RepID=A0ABR3FUN3_9AGAR
MVAAAVASSSDPASDWGQPESSTTQRHAPSKKSNAVVRDDWEDDDDDEEEAPSDEKNKQIWEEAYVPEFCISSIVLRALPFRDTKAPAPMPLFSPSSSRSTTSPPPPAAFQPALKILKRPTNAVTNTESRTPSPASSETLKEREARYQEARNRIFGEGSASSTDIEAKKPTGIARNPHGPDSPANVGEGGQAGFAKRRAQAPPQSPSK